MTTSPEATGQAGAFFEQHVDAAFLAFLLVRGTPPFLLKSELVEVHLQSGHLGWETDDLLAVGRSTDGRKRNAALQVKRSFSVGRSNKDCVDVFGKAWADFQSDRFERGRDALGLIAGPCSQRMQRGLRVLLSTARVAMDAQDTFRRLSLPKYRDKHALEYASTLRDIINARSSAPTTDDEFVAFLRHFDFVCLDLNTSTSSTEALILSLLGACAGPDAEPDTALKTWHELLQLVGRDMPDAGSFDRNRLPDELKDRFRPAAALASSALENLADTTHTIRASVDADVSGYHIQRSALEQQVIGALAAHRVLVVTGHAGSGKSAIARAAFDACASSRFSLAMRAGMLGRTHLSETLFSQGTTIRRLREVSALDGDKLLWIESGERLLEKPAAERQAFNDLLRLIRDDPGWRILITCRTYSAATFRSAFLEGSGVPSVVLDVPPLTDAELDELSAVRPALSRPLGNPRLRSLLRNPFLLGRAALVDWDGGRVLPLSKRSFRRMVWREIIRKDDETAGGMPKRRANCYIELAKRRAQALAPFVNADDLDDAALQKLKLDSLAKESDLVDNFWAPDHDVLEDWALLEWLDREHALAEGAWPAFLTSIGTHPATRRVFRMWLSERVHDDGSEPLDLTGLLQDVSIPAHWKDDALVAMLGGSNPGVFLSNNSQLFLAGRAALLCRALHLVRVACKEAPAEISGIKSSIAFVPVGPAWGALSDFAAQNFDALAEAASPLLAGFAEDWAQGVTGDVPYPSGAASVGRIVAQLLKSRELSRNHRSEPTETLLRVLLKIPREAKVEIAALADECASMDRLDSTHLFLRQVLNHLYSGPLCRDCPELVIRVLRRLVQPDKEPEPRNGLWSYSRRRMDLEQVFGMPQSLHLFSLPASAYHGPFLHLLRCHPGAGLGFVIEFVNQATATYLSPEHSDWQQTIGEVHVRLPDGSRAVHRGDARLWNMYRVNCGPELLRSALMALEKFLLEIGEQFPEVLPRALQRVMEESRNVALTSVAASVAMAYPTICGRAILPILECRIAFDWDHNRYVNDQTDHDRIFEDAFPATTTEQWLYNRERSEASEQPHRQQNLTLLTLKLQQTDLCERVWAIIDHHKTVLPPPDAQSDDDKLWRFQLHKMDVRMFEAVEENSDARIVISRPSTPPDDVRKVLDARRQWVEANDLAAALRMWAISCYERRGEQRYPANDWRDKLAAVQAQPNRRDGWTIDSRLLIAVVCCRDSFEQMTFDEREWCIGTIASAFAPTEPDQPGSINLGMGLLNGIKEAALELGGFLNLDISEDQRARLESALTTALLTGEHDVDQCAAAGIGRHLWKRDRQLSLSYLNALLTHAKRVHEAARLRRRPDPTADRDAYRSEYERAIEDAMQQAKRLVAERIPIAESALQRDYKARPWCLVIRELLEVLKHQPRDRLALTFFAELSQQLLNSWVSEKALRRPGRNDDHFDYTAERLIVRALACFGLGLGPEAAVELVSPFAQVAKKHPGKVALLAKELAYAEDQLGTIDTFWAIWTILSDSLSGAFNGVSRDERDVARALFLNVDWKETTKEWAPLRGREQSFALTYARIAPNSEVSEAFVSFLHSVGSTLLPDVLPILAEKIPSAPLSNNALYRLELILAELVYAGEPRIRRESELREATLQILGAMVDAGSSMAYRLRDDFITPLQDD